MSHRVSINSGVVQGAPCIARHSYHSGNPKGLEVHPQRPGTKDSHNLYEPTHVTLLSFNIFPLFLPKLL